ncbi:MAG TPA: porin family protein [Flavisolibacter sp.]|nr:porin family protein [Flavisolibacter sp.]
MKKISFFAIALCLVSALSAQEASLGLKAGLNVANLKIEGDDWGSKLGLHAGALAHIHLSRQFAIQPEIMYSSQGGKYTVSDGEHELGLHYINIPLQFQYMFNNGFRLQTGPQVGFLVDVKDKRNGDETGIFTSEDFNSVDFAWSAGLGYLTRSGLGIDARYNFGISNINDAGTSTIRNNVFQVGLFYMFDNSHKLRSR